MAGDDDPVPVAQRPSVQNVIDSPDLAGAIAAMTAHMTAVNRRYAGINEVLRGAADSDPDLRALWNASEDQRLVGAGYFVDILAGKAGLSVSRDRAIDILWLLMAGDHYHRLVVGRGWSEETYQRWLGDTIVAQLFTTAPQQD
jgi:hypothetical protein